MDFATQFIDLAYQHLGESYVSPCTIPLADSNYKGPWDCAEFITYIVYQVTGKAFGFRGDQSYTGYWQEDVINNIVISFDIEEAIVTKGAILLRYPNVHPEKPRGHIVFSLGNGKTIEAKSPQKGVSEGKISNRIWDCGIKIPNVEY